MAPALPARIDSALQSLDGSAQPWKALSEKDRAEVAQACRGQFATLPLDFVNENLKVYGVDATKPESTNQSSLDPFVFTSVIAERLDKIVEKLTGKMKPLPVARQIAEGPVVHKAGSLNMGAPGCDLEVWASSDSAELPSAGGGRGVCVVLGAGNQGFLTAVDVIERAFMHKECVFLKNHPLRPMLAPAFEHIFAPLAAKGAFAQCQDTDLQGAHAALCAHPAVMHLHMTGSGANHDRVIASLKAAGREDVGFTSELGCVTPWIVCPGTANGGKWSDAELDHHVSMLTAAFKANCSMNCLSPKLLVLPTQELWPQRAQFLDALRRKLGEVASAPPYYPGAHARFAAFEKEYPDAEKIESPQIQRPEDALAAPLFPSQDLSPLPSMLVDVGTLGAKASRPYAMENEAFAPVLAIGTVACESAAAYPLVAARAVNMYAFGTLSCMLIYPDARDAKLDSVVHALNYGCVCVNLWSAIAYSNSLGVWGGAPGSYSKSNPQSGADFIGNVSGIPNVLKGVAYSPFKNSPVSLAKPVPRVLADVLFVVASGQRCALGRIVSVLFRHMYRAVCGQ